MPGHQDDNYHAAATSGRNLFIIVEAILSMFSEAFI